MALTERNPRRTAGGSFLIEETAPEEVLTPEDLTEEQRMVAETTRDFIEREVRPYDEQIEHLDYELTVKLLRKAGELGLLGADVPEACGGLGLDKVSSTVISENLAGGSSFALSLGAHVGIGTLPIVFFGNDEQKRKYLPPLATGEKIAAYCLTEPSSGSDALGAKTTARLSEDGKHYLLNGSKIFITNGGFADIYIVYAKIDGTDFSAFIVERDTEGFTIGPEEKKMGIKGTSTVPLFFEDARVPVENLLGERGKGHRIAFNILNIGRFKLAAGAVGAAKEAIALSAAYANARRQFGKPLTAFPLIQQKLAEMNILTFALESCVYRTAGLIDGVLEEGSEDTAKAIAEYAIECSINKVFASEGLDWVVDEGVQIHGGYGYIQEYKIERMYRDSRINRIFEGTNEINRMLIPGMLLKKAMKGELPLLEKVQQLQNDLLSLSPPAAFRAPLEQEADLVNRMKKLFLFTGGLAVQTYGMDLEEEQEALCRLADLMILIFAAESVLLRTRKKPADHSVEMAQVFVQEAFQAAEATAKEQLAAMSEGDLLRTHLSVVRKLARFQPVNTTALKRSIASRVIAAEKYTV